jgi:hypothetical protein
VIGPSIRDAEDAAASFAIPFVHEAPQVVALKLCFVPS